MSNHSKNKNNLDYLKKLTHDLCKKVQNNATEQICSDQINSIRKLLENKKNKNPEKLLQLIVEIIDQENSNERS